MKKQLLGLFLSFGALTTCAQTDTTLVAHWDFNGTANDVSGNGHNGTAYNTGIAAGMAGTASTGYSFDGVTSYVSVPYSPAFNLTKYTICATVNVASFNTGTCQGNIVITRGSFLTDGCWALTFDDDSYNDCTTMDTTKELFDGKAGPNEPSLPSAWQYTPFIADNQWVKVVMTYDGTIWKMYINDTLRNTVTGAGLPNGTSTDSVTIGMDMFDAAAGFPYGFSGIMDDIMLYNIVLSDSAIAAYNPDRNGSDSGPTATANVRPNDNISIYPNPVTDKITIRVPYSNQKYDMQIINQLGQVCMSTEITGGAGDIDVAALPAGIYIMKLTCNGNSFYKKIQKN